MRSRNVVLTVAIGLALTSLGTTPTGFAEPGDTQCDQAIDELLTQLPKEIDKNADLPTNYEVLADWEQDGPSTQGDLQTASSDVYDKCDIDEDTVNQDNSTESIRLTCVFPVGVGVPLKCVETRSVLAVDHGIDCDNQADPSYSCWTWTSEGECLSLYDEGTCRLTGTLFDTTVRVATEPYTLAQIAHIPEASGQMSITGETEACHDVIVRAIGPDHTLNPDPTPACLGDD